MAWKSRGGPVRDIKISSIYMVKLPKIWFGTTPPRKLKYPSPPRKKNYPRMITDYYSHSYILGVLTAYIHTMYFLLHLLLSQFNNFAHK